MNLAGEKSLQICIPKQSEEFKKNSSSKDDRMLLQAEHYPQHDQTSKHYYLNKEAEVLNDNFSHPNSV